MLLLCLGCGSRPGRVAALLEELLERVGERDHVARGGCNGCGERCSEWSAGRRRRRGAGHGKVCLAGGTETHREVAGAPPLSAIETLCRASGRSSCSFPKRTWNGVERSVPSGWRTTTMSTAPLSVLAFTRSASCMFVSARSIAAILCHNLSYVCPMSLPEKKKNLCLRSLTHFGELKKKEKVKV